jgi:hypothetical protein
MIKSRRMRKQGMWQVWERGEIYTACWWGKLRERLQFGVLGLDGSVILKRILNKFMGQMDWIDLAQDRDE